MAIIYTYPVKTDPVSADKVLISDSEDDNKTKSVTIEDIRSSTVSGVSSIIEGNNITIDPAGGTGDVTINATAYTAGDGIDITAYAVSADIKANSGITIDGTEISLDLSASNITGTLAVSDGGTGAATLTGLIVGNGTSAFTDRGDIDDLYTAKFDTAANGSLYIGNIPSSSPSLGLNVVVGNSAGNAMTATSESNTLMGYSAGALVNTGDANVVVGAEAAGALTSGGNNTIIGRRANVSSGTDATSVAVGESATTTLDGVAVGATSSAGRDSVALGREATAGRDGIAIGSGAEALANELALGSDDHQLSTSTDSMAAATKWLKIKINGEVTDYYIPLQTLSP